MVLSDLVVVSYGDSYGTSNGKVCARYMARCGTSEFRYPRISCGVTKLAS